MVSANFIKELIRICRQVTDPSLMCNPEESLFTIIICDNSRSGNDIECSYSKTVGVGESRTLSQTEREQMTFSAELGFTVEAGIFGLKTTMSTKLGFSKLVGYEWSESDTNTWTEAETVSASISVKPYTVSKLEQLVGKCSFYGASTIYFKQTDIDPNGVETVRVFENL